MCGHRTTWRGASRPSHGRIFTCRGLGGLAKFAPLSSLVATASPVWPLANTVATRLLAAQSKMGRNTEHGSCRRTNAVDNPALAQRRNKPVADGRGVSLAVAMAGARAATLAHSLGLATHSTAHRELTDNSRVNPCSTITATLKAIPFIETPSLCFTPPAFSAYSRSPPC